MGKTSDDPAAARTMALAGELRTLLVALKRRLREESPPHDLSWSQLSVLGLLEREGPRTVSDLARAEGVRPQSMGETVASLQSAGLVVGSPDPGDGRRTLLSVTPIAREQIRARRAQREDWLFRNLRQNFSAQEQKEIGHAVALLRRLVEPRT